MLLPSWQVYSHDASCMCLILMSYHKSRELTCKIVERSQMNCWKGKGWETVLIDERCNSGWLLALPLLPLFWWSFARCQPRFSHRSVSVFNEIATATKVRPFWSWTSVIIMSNAAVAALHCDFIILLSFPFETFDCNGALTFYPHASRLSRHARTIMARSYVRTEWFIGDL